MQAISRQWIFWRNVRPGLVTLTLARARILEAAPTALGDIRGEGESLFGPAPSIKWCAATMMPPARH